MLQLDWTNDKLSSLMNSIDKLINKISSIFWPDLLTLSQDRKNISVGDVIGFLYTLPLAIAGLIWLINITDIPQISIQFVFFLFNLLLIFTFSQVNYFIIVEIRSDRFGSSDASFATMIYWSALFLFGPTAIWLMIIYLLINFLSNWYRTKLKTTHWEQVRNLSMDSAISILAVLISLEFYQFLGGEFPISSLSLESIIPALATLIIQLLLVIMIASGYIYYHIHVQREVEPSQPLKPFAKFFLLSFGLPFLANPFAILVAGLYVENGFAIYFFTLIGLFLVALLARQLSMSAEFNRQQSRQLERLELLGRELIDAPPDASNLSSLLKKHVPNMFPSGHISICLFPDHLLVTYPEDWDETPQETWQWVQTQEDPQAFLSNQQLPWMARTQEHDATIVAPITASESGKIIGGIFIELRALGREWDLKSLHRHFPAINSLAAQIDSALHRAKVYEQSLLYTQISQELRLAGRIQASFLPNKFPNIPGWQLAVTLLPARDTSGDFFDVIELSEGRLGIIVADVADKGVGAALYMALSRTLIRTYAVEYDAEPEVVFFAANRRLLNDARANLFVTAFYGILDPSTGILTFCNAGHNPPFIIRSEDIGSVEMLKRTGIAIGIDENATWTQSSVKINPGDLLILYTDGIPEAQDAKGAFFGEEKLIEIVQQNNLRPAYEIQNSILEGIENFVGDSAQFDDITLMILVRDV
jgi:serine phosphatase RsbU (regulator of sigma subunit)